MPSVREFVEFLRLVGQERSAVAGAAMSTASPSSSHCGERLSAV